MLALHLSSSVCTPLQPQPDYLLDEHSGCPPLVWGQSPGMLHGGMPRPQLPSHLEILTPPPEKLPAPEEEQWELIVEDAELPHALLWQTWTCTEPVTRFLTASFTNHKPFEINYTNYWTFPIVEVPFLRGKDSKKSFLSIKTLWTHRNTLCQKTLSTGMHMPASPGSFQVLDFTAKPCRTTLGTMRIKVFTAIVFMSWRENQMILKLWLVSSLASYCSHKPGLAAWIYRHNPPETSQLQFVATNYYPTATQLQVTVLSSGPHSPSTQKTP